MTTMTTEEQLFGDLKKDGIDIDPNTITKAKNGDGNAMVDIGSEYHIKAAKYDKAMAWYRLAAFKNNSKAQNRIGDLYKEGEGVPVDYLLALKWYLKAAAQRYNTACGNIGWLFENGLGVPVDNYKALEWHNNSDECPYLIEELINQGYQLTEQDKNKPIEQLIIETEDIAWPGKK